MTAPGSDEAERALAEARRLASEAGLDARPQALVALDGGRNNRVFRAETESGAPLVLKNYYRDARDPRDRRGAEWAFLTHAWACGVRCVPAPLATDTDAGLSLLGHIEGVRLAPGAVTRAHVDAAIDFVLAVNAAPGGAPRQAASEACFSLAEHIATVDRRVARLARLDAAAPHVDAAEKLTAEVLQPLWSRIRRHIETSAAVDFAMPLPDAATCLSPSDFGFHNALIAPDGRVAFIDFEYAGRDDPAKLVSDFFCQPDLPVPIAHHTHMVGRLAAGLGLGDDFRARCALLLDAYRIKWVCIMLNDFLPGDDARRGFASATARVERCAAQLAKARAALALIQTRN